MLSMEYNPRSSTPTKRRKTLDQDRTHTEIGRAERSGVTTASAQDHHVAFDINRARKLDAIGAATVGADGAAGAVGALAVARVPPEQQLRQPHLQRQSTNCLPPLCHQLSRAIL